MVAESRIGRRVAAFRVQAWAVWTDCLETGGAVQAPQALPASLRRRVTPIGRKALEAAWTLLAGRGQGQPRIILSSRHGEYARTHALLRGLAETGEVSPAEFSLAVHHGLAGLLSIATGNRAGHTAIAAGAETFAYALMEAAACLAEGEDSVLLMHFDEALPPDYRDVGGDEAPAMALAVLLGGSGGEGVEMEFSPADGPGSDCPAAAFIRLLRGGAEARAAGERMAWRWRRAA